jgi:hypothetical protein
MGAIDVFGIVFIDRLLICHLKIPPNQDHDTPRSNQNKTIRSGNYHF